MKDEKFDFLREAIKNWFSRAAVESGIIDPETWARFQSGDIMLAENLREWKKDWVEQGKVEGLAEGRIEGKAEDLAEGRIKGIAEGLAEGRIKGREEVILAQKTTLLEMLSDRFGYIPANWRDIIFSLQDSATISQLTRAILKVKTLEDYEALIIEKNSLQ